MTYQEAIKHFGTQVLMAEALGIKQPTISSWGGVIPDAYQFQIEVITDGRLRADDDIRRPKAASSNQPAAA